MVWATMGPPGELFDQAMQHDYSAVIQWLETQCERGALPVMLGGADLTRQGARAVPSLTYLDRQPNFSIGPDKGDDDNIVALAQMAALGQQAVRTTKTAGGTGASTNIVPQGGLFWDGRADTLQDQALFPLLDPNEMDGGSAEIVADKLRRAPYVNRFVELHDGWVEIESPPDRGTIVRCHIPRRIEATELASAG